ncbi:hypothetical protein CVT26_011280 [Gymnopilus dilepis]|uniref:Uncharacterized protein n=1 Tax=Gymnopilus dilepis TaxID=231916 RepID=A0A409VJH3_9AGAR|nr:hypothetical protein CVT26_011280 [Gymnopilus dilepis]
MFAKFFTKLAAVLVVAAVQAKASSYAITYYSDSNCQEFLGSSSGSFNSNGCLSGGNLNGVNSILISSLSDANIHTWAHDSCDHNEWAIPVGCGNPNACISAPGTNSIGYQTGCN